MAPHATETDNDSAVAAVPDDPTALLMAVLAQSPNDDWNLMRVSARTVARERRDENAVVPTR